MQAAKRSCSEDEGTVHSANSTAETAAELDAAHAHILHIEDVVPSACDCPLASTTSITAKCLLRAFLRQIVHRITSTLAGCLAGLTSCLVPHAGRQRGESRGHLHYGLSLIPATSSVLTPQEKPARRPQQKQEEVLIGRLRLVAGIYALLYAYSRKEREAAASLNDARLEQLVLEREQQISQLWKDTMSQHSAELKLTRERMLGYQAESRELAIKIEEIEALHAQHSLSESGSYQDSAATPPLLHSAADAVKDAIAICASDVFSITRRQPVFFNLPFLGLANDAADCSPSRVPQPSLIKVALQAFLGYALFEGFESSPCREFGFFEKPKQLKQRMFEEFIASRYMDDDRLVKENGDFDSFFHGKGSSIAAYFPKLLVAKQLDGAGAPVDLSLVCSEIRDSTAFYSSLLRLAKAVWLLRKLVFAFQPTAAEVLWVREGSGFDEEFMENVDTRTSNCACETEEGVDMNADAAEPENSKREDGTSSTCRQCKSEYVVKFMCVPGFTVRHTLIKSRVYASPARASSLGFSSRS